jgi:Bacterial DNA-binding protein
MAFDAGSLFGIDCVRCGNELIAPYKTEYMDGELMRFVVEIDEIGRNPRSGVKVEVPEKSVPVFRPSKEIGGRLNPVVSIPESSERTSRRSR